jgi:hypothetical protein
VNLRATLTGAGGGLLLGIADALTRRSVEIIDGHGIGTLVMTWPGYAVIGTAAIGLWLVESAFAAGPLHASLPAITGAEPLAGMTLGVLVFGDIVHITPWLLALQAAGLAAMVSGVILVARAPVFGKLRLQQAATAVSTSVHKVMAPEAPRLTVPEIKLPEVTLPDITLPEIPIPKSTRRAIQKLAIPLLRFLRLRIPKVPPPPAAP